jgi:hypothetical protein
MSSDAKFVDLIHDLISSHSRTMVRRANACRVSRVVMFHSCLVAKKSQTQVLTSTREEVVSSSYCNPASYIYFWASFCDKSSQYVSTNSSPNYLTFFLTGLIIMCHSQSRRTADGKMSSGGYYRRRCPPPHTHTQLSMFCTEWQL